MRCATDWAETKLFASLSRELLGEGCEIRIQARGASMSPAIRDGEIVYLKPATAAELRKGDIVLTNACGSFKLHRLLVADAASDVFITRGDCGQENDPAVGTQEILGVAVAKEVRVGRRIVRAKFNGLGGHMLRGMARGQSILNKILRRTRANDLSYLPINAARQSRVFLGLFALLAVFFAASYSSAQVAVDAETNGNEELKGTGTKTLTIAHTTTTTGTNLLMLVGVSMNVTSATTTTVTGVTYNATALTRWGYQNDAANTRRVEIWYLLGPSTGNHNVVVSVDIPATQTVGVVAGAVTFTGVDQTVPLSPFVSATGAAGAYSQLDVPSVVNGMILDTLAIGGTETITIPGPEVTQWNATTAPAHGAVADPPDVTGSGSTRSGAPSVPLSESFSANSNWSEGAVSINPTAADIGVTTSVGSAVFLGSNTVYTISVFNNGTSAANTVKLSDALASGMTLVSATTTQGSCTTANPIVCTIGTMNSGAKVTVTVTETAAASGAYANTATVSDSGTPPDPNTGNNTFTAVATVQAIACGAVSQAVPATTPLTGTLNTYYPGTASVAAGATSIPVGTPTGVGAAIAAGNLLLVIQMQDASINDSNSVAYGNGSTGQGFSAVNSAGDYEFVTASGPISGGSVPIAGAGTGGGLVFPYHAAAWSASAGQSTYQVIVVPQYTTATLASTGLTALPWNGSTGGVLVLDTSSALTLNGATVSMDGLGFRGGAGMELTGGTGANTDYLHAAPAAYGGVAAAGVDAPKGEGIAGTPLWVESGGTYLNTGTGYPSGTSGTDGSSARGAPGNAGAGGTDADPTANDQNDGGGGGGNGGAGGFGGDSWSTNLSLGGEGGTAFPATINRVAMGGGGGAGTRNNSDGDNQASGGAAGGGIIIIRAYALSGTATLTANGISAYNGTANDAGGGGGAGGSIVVLSANGGESGLTFQANGGSGGDAWASEAFSLGNRHGPGGGGGGGVVLVSGTPASISVAGGTNGLTETPGVAYGATPGAAGASVVNASITQTSGTQSGAQCTPDVTVSKGHTGNFTRGLTASYTIGVSNISPYGSTYGVVTVNDTLPTGLVPASASGTGWSCGVVSQTVSCTDSSALAGSSSYPSITVNATVSQSAPSTVTNTAIVGGGGEINLTNDMATDVANVISSADLAVTDSGTPNPVAAGGTITYAQTVTNNGPSAADNATLVATVPANTTFVSLAAPSGWSCIAPGVGSSGSVVCTNVDMAGSTAATFTLVTKVNTGVANGTIIIEGASVSSSAIDPNSANNSASVSTVVGITSGAQMTVTNTLTPDPVVAGNDITYLQTATNVGSAAATNATLSESTPANTTFQSISAPAGVTCTTPAIGGTGTISCTSPSAPAGSSGTVTLVLQVVAGTASGTVITDTATVTATNQAFGASSATATDVVASSSSQADLALTTAATPAAVFSGNDITYSQTITNNGPGTASSVSFTEATPANTTFVSVSVPAGWSCTYPAVGATGNVICTTRQHCPERFRGDCRGCERCFERGSRHDHSNVIRNLIHQRSQHCQQQHHGYHGKFRSLRSGGDK